MTLHSLPNWLQNYVVCSILAFRILLSCLNHYKSSVFNALWKFLHYCIWKSKVNLRGPRPFRVIILTAHYEHQWVFSSSVVSKKHADSHLCCRMPLDFSSFISMFLKRSISEDMEWQGGHTGTSTRKTSGKSWTQGVECKSSTQEHLKVKDFHGVRQALQTTGAMEASLGGPQIHSRAQQTRPHQWELQLPGLNWSETEASRRDEPSAVGHSNVRVWMPSQ